MNKLSQAIQRAVDECIQSGNSNIEVDENVTVEASWVAYYEDTNFDVVAIYIYENGVLRFSYPINETKTKA